MRIHPRDKDELARFGELLEMVSASLLSLHYSIEVPPWPTGNYTERKWDQSQERRVEAYGKREGVLLAITRLDEVRRELVETLAAPRGSTDD